MLRYGSDRSSVYVALSCLVQQLKTESRADVFTVVRKLRSQRQGMIQNVVSWFFAENFQWNYKTKIKSFPIGLCHNLISFFAISESIQVYIPCNIRLRGFIPK